MAAMVCHGLQSHLESQLVEPRTLRLKFPSSRPLTSQVQPIDLAFKSCFWDPNIKTHCYEEKTETNMGGWSFLEALSNVSQGPKEPLQKETSYVHPQEKRSSLLLSPRSLELCTENLGNESGTDIIENDIDLLSSSDRVGGNSPTREQTTVTKNRQESAAKKAKSRNFPPPLTTMRGSESLRVRPHREDGRLVIEMTRVPPSASCFQAERSHGRLRLCFLKNHTPSFDPQEGDDVTEDSKGFEEEFEREMNGKTRNVEEDDDEEEETGEESEKEETEEQAETEETGEEEEQEDVVNGERYSNIAGNMRMEKFERPRRCKEGDNENNELLNWGEPLWVAIS